jgi:dihydroorotate dehydrogenase
MSFAHELAAAALRGLDPEAAHTLAVQAVAAGLGPRAPADRWPVLRTTLAGLVLPNPIGVAAGFDKNAVAISGLLRAGFGFMECGTVTPKPQAGNPKPRLFRLSEDRAVINRMGFNNDGLDAVVPRLARTAGKGVIGVNIGANKGSADRAGDYVEGVARVWSHAGYVTINVSSPNTPGLRGLQEKGALEELLGRISAARNPLVAVHGQRPIFLKVAPDLDEAAIGDVCDLAIAYGLEGLVVSNTTIARPQGLHSAQRNEAGGLSGAPLFEQSTQVLRMAAQAARGKLALIGVGGIEDGAGAWAKIKAGASAVQLYSVLVFTGPDLITRILKDVAQRVRAEGFATVGDAIGADLT